MNNQLQYYYNTDLENVYIDNIYSDKNIKKTDVISNKSGKITTILKPYVWRNHTYNLPTNANFQNSNSKYSVGLEIVHGLGLPIILFRSLADRDIVKFYGYKIRAYKDMVANLLFKEAFITKSELSDEVDYINKIEDIDTDRADIIFSEVVPFGYLPESNEQHYIKCVYLKDRIMPDNFGFAFELDVYSERFKKRIVRNMGMIATCYNNIFNESSNTRHTSSIRRLGSIIGDYEHKMLGFECDEDESIEEMYQ